MDLSQAIRTTGAVRAFTDRAVDDATVTAILDDARFAPSGGNRQPWKVAVVKSPGARRALADLMQPVWDEYVAASQLGQVPFNAVAYTAPEQVTRTPNALLDRIETVPVVLVVAADQRLIVASDGNLDRMPIVPGASIYPFCWNVLLAARARHLGGVLTTFLSRAEADAARLLGLPAGHALAATIFLGYPEFQPTRLRRRPVDSFASVDTFDGPPL